MRKEDGLTPAEREFEEALAGLQPAGTAIDRDALLYRAGWVAGRRRSWAWQAMAAVLAAGLAVSLAAQGLVAKGTSPRQIVSESDRVRMALTGADSTEPENEAVRREAKYLVLRNEVLEKGLAALPRTKTSQPDGQPPLTVRELLGEPDRAAGGGRRLGIMDRILIGDKL